MFGEHPLIDLVVVKAALGLYGQSRALRVVPRASREHTPQDDADRREGVRL
jgi:hypothetical protein